MDRDVVSFSGRALSCPACVEPWLNLQYPTTPHPYPPYSPQKRKFEGHIYLFIYLFRDRVVMRSPGWSGAWCVDQAGLDLRSTF